MFSTRKERKSPGNGDGIKLDEKTLVLGVGNLLLSDDGVGIHAIQRLQAAQLFPEEVQVVDGAPAPDLLSFWRGLSA